MITRGLRSLPGVIALGLLLWPCASIAQTTATWSGAVDGDWADAAKWSTHPNFPNNGTPTGATYWANIDATGAAYQITLSAPIALQGLTLASPDATVNQSAALSVTGTVNLNAGTWLISGTGSTLSGTIHGGGGILNLSSGAITTLAGVNLGAPISLQDASSIQSNAQQILAGSGTLIFDSGAASIQSNIGTLTLGSGITTRTGAGSGSIGVAGSNIVNQGTISAQTGGQTIQLGLSLINAGTIEARIGGKIALPYTSLTQHPNFNRGTLTSGHWAVFNNSTISLGTSISRNDADVLLSGPNAFFGGMSSLRINTGTFALDAGQVFTTPTSFLNVGTVRVGDGSLFRVAGTLTNSGTIDLNEFMIVDYAAGTASPIDTIRQQILAGRNGGSWDAAGIIDSNARTNSSLRVGFADANQKFTNFPATFANQSVDDSAILLRETYGGDANLDGAVNIFDFNLLATSFGKTSRYWYNGDFTYDGNVTISDFNILATNFGKNLNALASPAQAPAALRITAESAAAIPLPSQVWTALATVAIAVAIGRRHFRSRCS